MSKDRRNPVEEFAGTYSPDVEIGDDGTLRWARDVKAGEVITIPSHMLNKVKRKEGR